MTHPAPPGLDAPLAERLLVRFLVEEAGKFGFSRGVVGLSGGIDSAVSLELAARAFGPDQVVAVAMPYRTSAPESLSLAEKAASAAGVDLAVRDISKAADAWFLDAGGIDSVPPLRRGNVMARLRMITLYDLSMEREALVVGTSNKTELLLGYGTMFGDMASAINPLGDLYKSQVYALARHLDVIAEIIDRPPSADLWEGQTDEQELGASYDALDALLHAMVDRRYSHDELQRLGFQSDEVERIAKRVRSNQYKRRPPVIAKLSNRTVNLDYRYARDWGA